MDWMALPISPPLSTGSTTSLESTSTTDSIELISPPSFKELSKNSVSVTVTEVQYDTQLQKIAPVALSCPRVTAVNDEFQKIHHSFPILASTGCSREFCQSGRMIHADESRVGRNRPLDEVQKEAAAFLLECRRAAVIGTDELLCSRLREVAAEIEAGSVEVELIRQTGHKERGLAGGNWNLRYEELVYGVRAAWRNARRCIGRSHHSELELCDLRHILTSKDMAETLIQGMIRAYNCGTIRTMAFVYPPREIGKRGPMVWNEQILAFAGYLQRDGSVLGDPKNVELTNAIIELGWNAPDENSRTQWDLLPIVTMAEGDEPFIMELPPDLRQVVSIGHPRYKREFEEMKLKWVAFPAMCRLGFDIGGVQFTASPFTAWFMDTEIGLRNLADPFRYNALPMVVKSLEAKNDTDWDIDELPEYEKLAVLSRAQTELNFAVHWSFIQAKVSIVDCLTLSARWTNFSDEYFKENGYRLPSDPYWVAPPVGSLVPVWHRGGGPNYQPKPQVCRHVQDPAKAWRRERRNHSSPRLLCQSNPSNHSLFAQVPSENFAEEKRLPSQSQRKTIHLFYCSSGIVAAKLATKLYNRVVTHFADSPCWDNIFKPQPLNSLELSDISTGDVLLLVVSTTGRGDIPRNAAKLLKTVDRIDISSKRAYFSVFGNGDSTYRDTYNAAAFEVRDFLVHAGMLAINGGVYGGDTSAENPPWNTFNKWSDHIQGILASKDISQATSAPFSRGLVGAAIRHLPAAILETTSGVGNNLVKVTLNVGDVTYQEMDHIRLFPPNTAVDVARALKALRTCTESQIRVFGEVNVTLLKFLTEYADLNSPFKSLNWLKSLRTDTGSLPDKDGILFNSLKELNAVEALERLGLHDFNYVSVLPELCMEMTMITPRAFSAASSLEYELRRRDKLDKQPQIQRNSLDIIVKSHHDGRFSQRFLSQAQPGATIRFSISPFQERDTLFQHGSTAPIIAVVTGSGIGPVRSLLRHRIAAASQTPDLLAPVSLWVGYKPEDAAVIAEAIEPAQEHPGIVDIVELVPSNEAKVRVQDRISGANKDLRAALKVKLNHPKAVVFVCALEAAADEIRTAFDILVREIQDFESYAGEKCVEGVKDWMGDRYIEEVFRY